MVSGEFVSTLVQHFVIEDVALDNHFATNQVLYMYLTTRFYQETHHILLTIGDALLALIGRHG